MILEIILMEINFIFDNFGVVDNFINDFGVTLL